MEPLLAWVGRERPDLLTFQEFRSEYVARWHSALAACGYSVCDTFRLAANDGRAVSDVQRRDGLLIASRWPVRVLDSTRLGMQWPERILSVSVEHPEASFELHTTHVPNGSQGYSKFRKGDQGARLEKKIDTLEAVCRALWASPRQPRILTGDFNEPKRELPTGAFQYWNEDGACPAPLRQRFGERWRAAGAGVFEGLPTIGVRDAYREVNGFDGNDYSWVYGADTRVRYRYDHIFASTHFAIEACGYDQSFREKPAIDVTAPSDHAAIWAKLRCDS